MQTTMMARERDAIGVVAAATPVEDPVPETDQAKDVAGQREDGFDGRVGPLLRRANQRANAIFQAHFADRKLTQPQLVTLARLHDCGQMSQNSLGRMVGMDAATMQGVVRRLVTRGLIRRSPDAVDRRRLQLSLTEAGAAEVTLARTRARQVEDDILGPLSSRERATFLRLLGRLG